MGPSQTILDLPGGGGGLDNGTGTSFATRYTARMTVQVNWGNLITIALAGVVVLIPIIIGLFRKRKESGFMQQIAQALAFSYRQRGDGTEMPAGIHAGGQVLDVIAGSHNGVDVTAFTYRVWVNGKNGYWSYMTVLTSPLPVALPDIVLRPNQLELDAAAVMAVERTSLFDRYQQIALEGDFGKYFTLFAIKGTQIEAREIFTPDIMADLIDNYRSHGLEFKGNTLYFFPMKLIEDEASLTQECALLERLATNLAPALRGMASDAPSQEAETSAPIDQAS